MVNPAYKKYMGSETWVRKKYAYFGAYGKKCQACGTGVGPIHVHHMTYDRLGRELLTDLCGLCDPCHKEVHKRHRAGGRKDLMTVTIQYVKEKRGRSRR